MNAMTSPVVAARNLGKTYKVYSNPWERVLEAVIRRPRHRPFVALEGVSFELPRGEGLGVVGQNGAGKSTLLKILAGIVAPSEGALTVAGKTAAILELGSGFHPEFTGRQNIRLNAAMLGLTAKDLEVKLPEIIEFSELGDFIDQPVKTYSTGMAMRLGFAIATQVEPDVLIIDEALSVGDGYFQKKCMDHLQAFLSDGGTLLFCSHAMYYVSAFCQQALWLRHGRVEAFGETQEVVRSYQNFLLEKSRREEEHAAESHPAEDDAGNGRQPAHLTAVRLDGGTATTNGRPRRLEAGDSLAVEVEWECASEDLAFHVGVGINRIDEVEVLAFSTHRDGRPPIEGSTSHSVRLEIPDVPMHSGCYTLYIFLLDREGLHIFDRRIERGAFEMVAPSYVLGLLETPHTWRTESALLRPARPGRTSAAGIERRVNER